MRVAIAVSLALASLAPSAHAADIAPDGGLSFAPDALATCGFESLADLTAAGAAWVDWSSDGHLVPRALAPVDVDLILTDKDGALEGRHGLRLRDGLGQGVALRLPALAGVAGGRFSVSVWGRAHGAEPVLEIVYAHDDHALGPNLPRVLALRTGRETSDGWVEYATGPIDGTVLTAPARAVVLSARYATRAGASMLIGGERAPTAPAPSPILDPSGYAVVDAVEVRPEAGEAASPTATCTQATVDAVCGRDHECEFGHCLDAAAVWGPVPASAEHRRDLVARWAFVAQHLHADRQATAAAATAFAGCEDALSPLTSPRGFYGGLARIVAGIRDSHTSLGTAPSGGSVVYPTPDSRSGPLDLCFGVASNDLGGGEQVFAVFSVSDEPAVRTDLRKGDVLTAVDGVPVEAWIAAVLPRFVSHRPNDPAADPTSTALILPKLLGRFAATLTFSRCRIGGGCAPLPDVPVAAPVYAQVARTLAYAGSARVCSPRFHPAVARPPEDGASADTVVYQTVTGVTSVQFDGFEARYSPFSGWHAWEDPWNAILAEKAPIVVDARLGHGGKFALGRWLFHLLRGQSQPYGAFAMPRGAYDDPDPPWLFAPRWDACAAGDDAPDACAWTGGQTTFTSASACPGEGARIAWIEGSDVSMNDIVPRLLSGRTSFRVFGPHPSQGAYGEISALPPIEPTWGRGSLQVLDMRFGPTPAEARGARWESGKGVVPDEVVAQKVSDILADRDTVLDAAIAWVSQ